MRVSGSEYSVRKISFVACAALVILRLAIGWQFLYEGLWKLNTLPTATPWTAEGYLKNAVGPFRQIFRDMIDDPNDLEKLDFPKLAATWDKWADLFYRTYPDMSEEQKKKFDKLLKDKKADLEQQLVKNKEWAGNPDQKIIGEIQIYKTQIDHYEQRLKQSSQPFQQEHLDKSWAELQAKRKQLVGPIETLDQELKTGAQKLLTFEQLQRGRLPALTKKIDDINFKAMWGLIVVGALLILGLFTRLASLGGVGLLLLFYLAAPPWPGVPEVPGPEHSFIVNKNLIEAIALLGMASLPTGRWFGLDAGVRRFLLGRKTD